MKRKAEAGSAAGPAAKRKARASILPEEAKQRFRDGLFEKDVLKGYTSQYTESSPYKHCVINGLINDQLLRDVRTEINANIVFTLKETDIYKIHQSGDLANLDGLDDESLAKLPSLLKLRDALYSQSFRDYVSSITGCGPLSGRKRDLAINTYKPGGYLICHDDVIGTRKVSYILYLVDPDLPWKADWGGALRLFPVRQLEGKDGVVARAPGPDHVKAIPPAWNQLSFFEVQPNESFHDVEEVYRAGTKEELKKDGGRVRMAISGWFHIPQIGEDGYEGGAAEVLEKNSGLAQLQGNPDQYDMPQANVVEVEVPENPDEFSEQDFDFLVKYIAPQYLTPEAVGGIEERFCQDSCIALPDFLHPRFAERLREYVVKQESTPLPESSVEIEKGAWKVAKPPHKHRFVYLQTGGIGQNEALIEKSPLTELMDDLLPSPQFRKWLRKVTDTTIESHDIIARRFRRGMDYTLATGHEGKPRLELNLGFTPTPGWKDDGLDDGEDVDLEDGEDSGESQEASENSDKAKNGEAVSNGKAPIRNGGEEKKATENGNHEMADREAEAEGEDEGDDGDVGGHEIYMAADDDGEDAAVYKAAAEDEDSVLFSQAAAFNRLTLVLRDSGILRFVKYVSKSAQGDRWDISATYELDNLELDDGEDEEEEVRGVQDDTEEEFQGFSDHEEEDTD